MAAADQKKKESAMAWLWVPVGNDKTFPAETPKDEGTATKRWSQNMRGPGLAKIVQVNVMFNKPGAKPDHLVVTVNGNVQEVPKHLVIHEREGFLILQELVGKKGENSCLNADWVDADLRAYLEQQKTGKPLQSAPYVSKFLMKKAVTGVMAKGAYRRDLFEKDEDDIPAGVEKDGFFCIKELAGYMPPWEAFCHSKCGFFQDFYKVRWADPYCDTDYRQVENGCTDEVGCTWEPDENLPTCLDSLRIKAKKVWLAKQVDSEEAKRKMEQAGPEDAKRLRLPTSVKSERSDKKKAVETAQWRRDITPLDSDIFRFQLGHDFVPQNPDKFPSIRKGWPLHAKDYPVGYSVCTPPGFCWDGCDCMDDQRGQREWEVTKSWIPKARGAAAQAAIDNFSRESNFVRARGQVSKTFYFETASALVAETPAQRAAADLALTIQGSLREVCSIIPAHALSPGSDPLHLPLRSIISIAKNGDYLPLSVHGKLENGGSLPSWIELDVATGLLSISPGHKMAADVKLVLELMFSEGTAKIFPCTILASGQAPPLSRILKTITSQLRDTIMQHLDGYIRSILEEQLEHAATFSLGKLVKVLVRCQNLLRASAVANLTVPGERRPLGKACPRTPP